MSVAVAASAKATTTKDYYFYRLQKKKKKKKKEISSSVLFVLPTVISVVFCSLPFFFFASVVCYTLIKHTVTHEHTKADTHTHTLKKKPPTNTRTIWFTK